MERLLLRKELREVTPYFRQLHLLAAGLAQAALLVEMAALVVAVVAIQAQIGQAVPVILQTLAPLKETMAAQVFQIQI